MNNIVGITFNDQEKTIYFFVNDLQIKKNITVIVDNDGVLQFGKVKTDIQSIDGDKINKKLGKIIRVASKKDYLQHQNNLSQAKIALKKCKELVEKYNLQMNVIDSIYTFDQSQLVFHFYANARIDFRNLARDLASIYKTRIELRQIGVRDKAKKVCGVGICGQKLCCSRFLDEFESVSISMAKNQNLSLNPTKINGVCGRLLCCLKYEDDCYKSCRKGLPNIGQVIDIEEGTGRVIAVDILTRTYKIDIQNKGIIEVKLDGCN